MENCKIVRINQFVIQGDMIGPQNNNNPKLKQKPEDSCHIKSVNGSNLNNPKFSLTNSCSTNFYDQHNYNMQNIYKQMMEDKKRHEIEMNKLLEKSNEDVQNKLIEYKKRLNKKYEENKKLEEEEQKRKKELDKLLDLEETKVDEEFQKRKAKQNLEFQEKLKKMKEKFNKINGERKC